MPPIQITQSTIVAAKAKARPGAAQSEITDSRAEGLRLRIGARGVIWQYRFKSGGESRRLNMGSVDSWDIAEARKVAGAAKDLVQSGRLPDEAWLDDQRVAFGKREAAPELVVPGLWSWEEAKTEYLAEVERTRKPATLDDYRRMLGTPELSRFHGREVAGIRLEEMAQAVEEVHRRGVERHAEHVASVVRPMWHFLGTPSKRSLSGVASGTMKELRAPERSRDDADNEITKTLYVPPMLEVGRIVAICRSGALHPVVAGAIELTVFTCQRVSATAQALRDKFTDDPDYDTLWAIPAAHRKTARRLGDKGDHVLPLPAPAWQAALRSVEWCVAADDDRLRTSLRVFPQLRPGKAANPPTTSSHMSQSTITHTLSYLPGVTATPHDLRRAFGTHGEVDLDFTESDTKLILDHHEGRKSTDVTARSYAIHHRLAKKAAVLDAWAEHVEKHVLEAMAADPRLSDVEWIKRRVQIAQDVAKNMKPRHPTIDGLAKLPQGID